MPMNATRSRRWHYARSVAAAAYLFLPVTGLVAYLAGRDARTRWHGLQAIAIGLVWPLGLYFAGLGPSVAVRVVFLVGAVVWLGFLVVTGIGRDPRLPIVGSVLERWAAPTTKDVRRSTSGN